MLRGLKWLADHQDELEGAALGVGAEDLVGGGAQRRAVEESEGGTPGPVTSIFKVCGTELQQTYYDMKLQLRGIRGYPDTITDTQDFYEPDELETTKNWLFYRAASIYSGSNEVQRNIIAKRVLGLPD